MKVVFNIEAVEDIISNLRSNYNGQIDEMTLLEDEKKALSLGWQSESAQTFYNNVDSTLVKAKVSNDIYNDKLLLLEKIKNDYSNAKDSVRTLSTQLWSNAPSVQGTIYSGERIEITAGLKTQMRSLQTKLSSCQSQIITQIDKIKSAWKDGDETNLVYVLTRCSTYIGKMISVCHIIELLPLETVKPIQWFTFRP